ERARGEARFRVWVTAGNHDWNHRVNPAGEERIRAAIDTTSSAANAELGGLWQEPALVVAVPGLPAWLHLLAVDTQTVVSGSGGEVLAAVMSELKASPEPAWDVVAGHHVPASTGPHAASKERDDEVWSAALDLMRPHGLDLVLAGHDHHQELLVTAGLPVVVVGNSSKGRDVVETPYAPCSRWSRAGTEGLGFAIVTFTRDRAELEFHDTLDNVVHRAELAPLGPPPEGVHVGSCR
ncbi:MAG: metallophosphoesterase, partial [Myxococcales bacterium]|nr:metallophosphoesterase [Myxococcales bacterium]